MPNLLVPGDSSASDQISKPHLAVPGDRAYGDGSPIPRPIDPFRDGPLPSDGGNPLPPGYVNQTASERNQGAVTGPDAVPVVYGEQMVEGRVISVGYDLYNRWRDFVIGVAAGEVYSVALADSPAAVFQSDPGWHVYLGPLTQTPYPTLAYVTARQYLMYWDGTTWLPYNPPIEMPSAWRFVVKGRLVTDTRSNATGYSTNPAMCLRNFLLSGTYGGYMWDTDFDEQSFKDAADICDQVVDGKKRYELNIAILSEASVEQWIETICTHFAAKFYLKDGKYRLWVDGITADSGIVFDTSNSRDWKLTETPVSERPSRVVVEYPRADNAWAADKATAELPGASSSGQTREAVYKMEGITDAQRAQRLAEYLLKVQATAPLRATFTASPLAARLARGSRFKLSFPNGCQGQDFIVTDMQPLESGEFAIEAREYDPAVYTPGVVVTAPSPPNQPPDPGGTVPDVTVVGWGTHEVITSASPAAEVRTQYAYLDYTLPSGYLFGQALVIRGKAQNSGTIPSDLSWDSLADEVIVPLTGNLPPNGAVYRLYWPYAVGGRTSNYYASGVQQSVIDGRRAHQVTVKVRSIIGNLSSGVTTRLTAGYSSIASRGNDTGSAVYNTQDLRLLEAAASGTKAVSLKAPDSLLADRAIVVPGDAPVANGFVRTDASGNWSYSGFCAFAAYRSADQTGIVPDTQTKVDFDTEEFDQGGCFDTGSKRFLAPLAGKYLFTAAVGMIPDPAETLLRVSLRVNGTEKRVSAIQGSLSSRGLVASVTAVLDLAADDHVEVYVLHTKAGNGTVISSASVTYFNGTRVG